MKKLVLFLVIVIIMLTLASCTGSLEDSEQKTTTTTLETITSSKRTDINLATTQGITLLDPHNDRQSPDIAIFNQIYEGLYFQDDGTTEMTPRIAESYEVSDDGIIYTFKIRDGVKFHNGDTLTVNDVVWSILRAKECPAISGNLIYVDTVEAVDNKVVITLSTVYQAFMSDICSIAILSQREVEEQGDAFGTNVNLAGTGPYYPSTYDSTIGWTLTANPDYYLGEAVIKTVNYAVIPDSSSGLIAFESGELDWYSVPQANFASIKSSDNYSTEVLVANHITYFFVNPAYDAFNNPLVRQAVGYAIDKEAINLSVYDGQAKIANRMVDPNYVAYAPSEEYEGFYYTYNPEKAKELLAEAGYPDGLSIGPITCAQGTDFEKIALIIQANLAAIGIKSEIQQVEYSAATARYRVQDYVMAVHGHNNGYDCDRLKRPVKTTMIGSIYVNFAHDSIDWQTLDGLFDKGAAEIDDAARIKIYEEVNDRINEAAGLFPILHKTVYFAWNHSLNVVNCPNYYYLYDWSWN